MELLNGEKSNKSIDRKEVDKTIMKIVDISKEEKEIYKNIIKIKEYILTKQKFELPESLKNERPFSFLKDNFDEINNL